MANRSSSQRLLSKARRQHRIIADKIRKDNFDCVLCFEVGVPALEDDSHATLAQTPLEMISTIERGLANQRRRSNIPIVRTVCGVVWEAALTGGAFLHRA